MKPFWKEIEVTRGSVFRSDVEAEVHLFTGDDWKMLAWRLRSRSQFQSFPPFIRPVRRGTFVLSNLNKLNSLNIQ
jgi:hypothetical protein